MMNLSMLHRPLSSIPLLLLAMAVGCTERPSNDPVKPADQVLAQEKKAGGEAAPGIEVEATEDGVSVQGKASDYEGGFFRRQEKEVPPEEVERQLSKLGPVRLELSDEPPTADPVESGTYLLSIVIQLTSGSFNKDQWPCRVEVDGPQVTILLENRQTDPIFATLEDGHFLVAVHALDLEDRLRVNLADVTLGGHRGRPSCTCVIATRMS